jgi:hypothetical protein
MEQALAATNSVANLNLAEAICHIYECGGILSKGYYIQEDESLTRGVVYVALYEAINNARDIPEGWCKMSFIYLLLQCLALFERYPGI